MAGTWPTFSWKRAYQGQALGSPAAARKPMALRRQPWKFSVTRSRSNTLATRRKKPAYNS